MSTLPPVAPEQGIATNFGHVDRLMKVIEGRQPADATMAHMSVAQVFATCALVHAVRQLTDEIRQSRGDA